MDISRAVLEPGIVLFWRQYMQQIKELTYPSSTLLVHPDVQHSLYRYFFDSNLNTFLPTPQYQAKVLRRLISDIEKSCRDPEEDQVSDQLMEHMGYLMSLPQQDYLEEVETPSVHSYYPPLPLDTPGIKPVLINEAKNLLSKGNNVGLRTWEAALHLAWFLFDQRPDLVHGKNAIELGAGTGFLSLLCAGHLKASHVTATDGLGHVCESLQANVDINVKNKTLYGAGAPEVMQLDWTDDAVIEKLIDDNKKLGRPYELITGADITYHPDILRPLAKLLSRLKHHHPASTVIISATIRSDTFSNFLSICHDEFDLDVVEQTVRIPAGLRYSGFFHSIATPIKVVLLERHTA